MTRVRPRRSKRPVRARTGGRSARVVDQVLTATVELLGRSGYGSLRVEEVAERSGVNKTTIYRRWPTKGALVAAAIRQHHVLEPAPDTGQLLADLVEMFEAGMRKFDSQVTRGVLRMMQTERGDPEVDAIIRDLRASSLAIRRIRFDIAIARGELPKKTDVVFVNQLISGAIYNRVVTFNEPVDIEYIKDVVTVILAGARAHYR